MVTKFGLESAFSMAMLLAVAGLWCRRQKVAYGVWIRLCVAVLPLSLVMSRLFFAASALGNGDLTNPVQALYFWDGGASVTGALVGAVIGAALVEKLCRAESGVLLDGIALGAPLALFFERTSEFAFELGFGRIIDTEFLTFLGGLTDGRHPVFLYESAYALLLLAVLARYATGTKRRSSGDVLLTFLVLYGSAQMFFESLRDDAHMVIYFIRINQIAALMMVVTAFVIWAVRAVKRGTPGRFVALISVVLTLAIVQGIIQEFAVDSNPNLLLEYAIMAACVAVMAKLSLTLRHQANR